MADALQRSLARQAALERWDRVADRTEATQALRDGFMARLRADVLRENPGLADEADEAEIENRVQRKLKLHYEKMRASSLRTRRAKAAEKRQKAKQQLETPLINAIIAAENQLSDRD